jgi:nicotinamide phosphoribosyltransferase
MNTKLTENLILNTDSYKLSHFGFEEPGTTKMVSYIEARDGGEYDETIFFGLQYFIRKYMETRVTRSMVDQAEKIISAHGLPFNREGWDYIVDKLGGRLPLRIRAVKEGTLVPTGNVLATIENTDENCAWVVSYFETALLRAVWYGTTVATRAFKFRQLINRYLEETGDPTLLAYKFIDFGSRGASSKESSEIAGAAHQASFAGTDNIVGILAAMEYYNCDEVPSHSIPASEHTVTISWGKDREKEFFQNALKVYGGEGNMVSIVSDTYSMENALKIWGEDLKEEVLAMGGTVVVRPDSGNPTEQVLNAVTTLDGYYGSTTNEKGYRVLHPSVRVIQGDGISLDQVEEILETLKSKGYSADNVTFGCGGYLLQDLTRDTCRFAMKGCLAEVNGEVRKIQKTVETDPTKASKAGDITLVKNMYDKFATIEKSKMVDYDVDMLETVYNYGVSIRDQKFEDIRNLVSSQT